MARTMLMHAALRCPQDTLSTDIWPMAMHYYVWVYNRIPDMQSWLSAIEMWSSSMFDPVSETLSNCHVWVCPTYVSKSKFHNTGVKIPTWDPRSRKGVNMGFSKIHSAQFWLVLNLSTGSISPKYHVIFYYMLSYSISGFHHLIHKTDQGVHKGND